MAVTCGYGEELSGSINAGNILTSCKVYWLASQEGLCSMEQVSTEAEESDAPPTKSNGPIMHKFASLPCFVGSSMHNSPQRLPSLSPVISKGNI